jgi:hypothetical protein
VCQCINLRIEPVTLVLQLRHSSKKLDMNDTRTDTIFGYGSLIVGQTLHTVSTFLWTDNGRHSIDASVLIILAMVFWAYGFIYLFTMFKEKNPWYFRLGLMYALYGCLGGIAFGFEGLYSAIFSISDKIGVDAYNKYPAHINLVLYWAGPAFPLSLLLFGIMLLIKKAAPWTVGMLFVIGAVAFPISRILRIDLVAHIADFVLLMPLIFLFIQKLSAKPDFDLKRATS